MLVKSNLIVDLLFHLIFCPMVYGPSSLFASNVQPLGTSDSFLNDYYLDSGGDSSANGARDSYGNQLSQGYQGSGYQAADSSGGRYSSGKKGQQSHLSSSNHKQSDGSLKHSEGSIEAEKDRVVKHQWDRGGGYVKEWNWDKGVHYEKESGSVSASDLKHKESEKSRQSGERSKGSAGWQEHKNKDHERQKSSNGWGKEGYRNEGANKYADRYGSDTQGGYNKIGSISDEPWTLKGEYMPLKAAASGQPYGYAKEPPGIVRIPSRPHGYQHHRSNKGWPEKSYRRDKNDYNNSLRELIEKKYMPIYRKYSMAAKRERERSKDRSNKKSKDDVPYYNDLRLALSKEFLKPQGRWKLGHLFGNGLDSFSPSSRFVWH
ncbi:uncharacterized protein LOC128394577 [Panonychus citri]|uniref:uncharacterized protein LOC128394577 n=1 Tax=Panonychus citri TaxID=50023 RepID=UPI00230818D3|nr:uncharacterized protein LOC128394577 [Panonychus citri]